MKMILFVVGIILILSVHVKAQPVLMATESTSDPERQWVFIIVNVDGEDHEYFHVAPAKLRGPDLQAYINGQEKIYQINIRQDLEQNIVHKHPPRIRAKQDLKGAANILERLDIIERYLGLK